MGCCGSKTPPAVQDEDQPEDMEKENLFEMGDAVVLTHFEDRPEYEGREGWIVKPFIEEKGRWPVRLNFNNKVVNVSPDHLKLEKGVAFKPQRELLLRVAAKLPTEQGEFSEDEELRTEWFESMDANGSARLSLAEIDTGVKTFLGEECFLMKPAIKEAYKASKSKDFAYDDEADHFVEESEFRYLLCYLKVYIELYAAFDEIDSGDDDRVSFEEFETCIEFLKEYGLTKLTFENAKETFDEIDVNGGGQILFNEFAQWVLHDNQIQSLTVVE